MAILSLVYFAFVVADLALPPGAAQRVWFDQVTLGIWSIFILEYLLKLALSPDRRAYVTHRWLDLVVLILPMVRWLRMMRLFRSSAVMFRLGIAVRRGTRGLGRFLAQSRFSYVLALTVLVVLSSSAAMLILERDTPSSPIKNYGDALWWSAAITTTVSSDLHPRSPGGKVLAIAMMIYGMGVFGYFVSHAVGFIGPRPQAKRSGGHPVQAPRSEDQT